ncbi:MAG: BlaI/MecI/CopY family transcriptional regulator [Clostridia bacterium]|nr:BlaI/MecI/CopY family transcriptional regulator [Clostridia bacterium]
MQEYTLGAVEQRFAELIWAHEPIASGELVKLCERELSWKKSTTYTMLRRLCQRGLFCNEEGVVRSCMSEQGFRAMQSERFVEEIFHGSLPQFLTAFATRKQLSDKEIAALQALIDEHKEDM